MANKVRVRVEARRSRGRSFTEQQRAFRAMLQEFKRRVADQGILKDYKERSVFRSKGEKARRKRREASIRAKQEQAFDAGSTRQGRG